MKRLAIPFCITLLICLPFCGGVVASKSSELSAHAGFSKIIGNWQSTSFGTQLLKAKSDGTAELKMRLSTMAAVLYGRDVTLQLEWKFDGTTLTHHIVGGSPERSVHKLIQKFGESFAYDVVELTGDHLTVKDVATGKTCYWDAVPGVE